MAGMAPYVINAGLGYEDFEKGIDAGLFYNVQGPTLVVVGSGIFPDVETEPFHSLNFNANKSFGVDKGLTLGLSISNLLNDRREEFYESFGSSNQIFTGFSPGVEFGFSLGYKF